MNNLKSVFIIKIVILLFLFFPYLFFAQIPKKSEQLKVTYSIEYEKIPFKMRMFKKHLPTESINYYSALGSRHETNIVVKMMGEHMTSSSVFVKNDSLNIRWEKIVTIVNDSIVDNHFLKKKDESENAKTSILLGNNEKNILGYHCVSFSVENDSSKTNGFLAPSINGKDKFEPYGLPLEFTITSKKEKTTIIKRAKTIIIEPLNRKKFILTE